MIFNYLIRRGCVEASSHCLSLQSCVGELSETKEQPVLRYSRASKGPQVMLAFTVHCCRSSPSPRSAFTSLIRASPWDLAGLAVPSLLMEIPAD